MKAKIVTGTKINEIRREIGIIRRMNQKGTILPKVAKILSKWDISDTIKTSYYRISKWK
jgi:hypothetical protein